MILIGDDHGYLRRTDNLVTDAENGLEGPGTLNLEMAVSVLGQVFRHSPFGRFDGIGLGLDIGCHGAGMASPVIHQPGHMDDFTGIVREPQNHVVVLAAVVFFSEQFVSVQQLPGKNAEMADIIVGAQIIRGIARLKMHGQHTVDIAAFKGSFVAVQVIRILLVDCLYIFVEYAGMEKVVLIQQPDIFSRCHLQAGVGVPRYAFVFIQMLIDNPAFRPGGILPADIPDIAVGFV